MAVLLYKEKNMRCHREMEIQMRCKGDPKVVISIVIEIWSGCTVTTGFQRHQHQLNALSYAAFCMGSAKL